MNSEFIELINDGKSELFEILMRFKFKGEDYIALRPESEDEDSAAIFKIEQTEEEDEIYSTIEDENLAKEIFVHFVSIWELSQDED